MSSAHPKRKLSPSNLTDGTFSIVRYPIAKEPSNQDIFALNFFPERFVIREELDPICQTYAYYSGGRNYELRKLRVMKQVTREKHQWFDALISHLLTVQFEIPDATVEEAGFQSPKKTCKLTSAPSLSSNVPVSNTFAVLDTPSASMDTVDSPTPKEKPAMVFKRNIPPISVKTSDPSALDKLRSVLHQDTIIHYRQDRLRIQPSSVDEYKSVLDFVSTQQWEYFTYNPVVTDSTKSVLRGLPPSTSEEDIRKAIQDKGVCILHVRQLWKSTKSPEGVWSRTPLPVWYITHSKESKPALRAIVGLLHFRIHFEDPKKRGSLPQCFRCLEFGHHANFCKQQLRCRICADSHDSRACPTPQSTHPKCHNCQGDHMASSKDCPHRQRLQDSVRRPSSQRPLSQKEFPPLRQKSSATPVSSDSSLSDLLRLFSSPEAKEVVSLLSQIFRTCLQNPAILRNIATFLTAFK